MICRKLYQLYGTVWDKLGNFKWLKEILIKKTGEGIEILKENIRFYKCNRFCSMLSDNFHISALEVMTRRSQGTQE